MKIAIIGSGGREHTMAWKMSLCESVHQVYVMPGNPGMESTPGVKILNISPMDFEAILKNVQDLKIDLVIVGPEDPLDKGIVDFLEGHGVIVLGPNQQGAKMESSKAFSKKFMQKYQIPTAGCRVFSQYKEALEYLNSLDVTKGIVLKADELAGGKGVVVTKDSQVAAKTLFDFMQNPECSVKTKSLLFEDLLLGNELSAFALYDGETYINLGYARDFKRVYDNDQGPNTGGMGTFSELDLVSPSLKEKINQQVFTPVLEGMKKEGTPFKGFLFAGLMIDGETVNVIEFNVRFGDPETQVIFPRMNGDIAKLFEAAAKGQLTQFESDFSLSEEAAVHVVMCSEKYPSVDGTPMNLNNPITLDENYFHSHDESMVFYAGVKKNNLGQLINSSGRVLGVTAMASNRIKARELAYQGISKIQFAGAHYRNDIAK